MEIQLAAALLKELGHPTRLALYRRLVVAGGEGLPVGQVQKELNIPASTLSHHIAALVGVGLVQQKRHGRILFCTAQYAVLQELIYFLTDQCCAEEQGTSLHSSLMDATFLAKE